MARTTLAATILKVAASAAEPAAVNTTAGDANGVIITGTPAELLVLRVTGTNAGNVLVKGGSGVAATAAGQGDLTVAVASGGVAYIGPFESARHQQADGNVYVDTSAAMAVQAFRVNRH